MKMTITTEQKWVMGVLTVALLAAIPSFFMKKSRSRLPHLQAPVVNTQSSSGEDAPIVESNWVPRAMSDAEQSALQETLKVDLNHADGEALNGLPGVGDGTARAIVEYRESRGCFKNVEELQNVKGFGGGAKFEAIKDHIRVDVTGCVFKNVDDDPVAFSSPKKSKSAKSRKKSAESEGPVNINTASAEELDALPGIGKTSAQRIIEYREENGRFGSLEDLKNVKGIKDATIDKIRDLATY